ncbi:MAG: lysophospholipid acyltransferase family protein, partial [Aurantibacter sp.]
MQSFESQKKYYWILRRLVAMILKLFTKIQVVGLDHINLRGPAILVCNHRSDIDPSVITSVIPRYICWIAANYMKQVPMTGWIIKKTGMILMDVQGKVSPSSYKRALEILDRNEILGIFPEGENYIFNNDFSAPLVSFHPGFGIIALKKKAPIIPVMICPLKEKLKRIHIPNSIRKEIGKVHDLEKIKHMVRYKNVKVIIGEPINIETMYAGDMKLTVSKVVQKTREVMLKIQKEFE